MKQIDITTITGDIPITNPTLISMHKEADNMQAYMNIPVTLEDPASLTERLKILDVYLPRLSDMLQKVKSMKEYALNQFLQANENEINKLSATISNRIIKTFLFEFNVTVDRLDSMYTTMTQIDRDLVTQISYIKQQMTMR